MRGNDPRMKYSLASALVVTALAQQAAPPAAPSSPSHGREWTTADDHRHMMEQLGIAALRPGPSGNELAPNHANYDEALANPFPALPDALTLRNGRKVTTADMWRSERRPEIVEDFERQVIGRVPKQAPRVTWTAIRTVDADVAGRAVVGKRLVGHVDNSSHPAITVDIQLILVTPSDVNRPAPVMIMFRGGGLPGEPAPDRRGGATPAPAVAGRDPPATEQLIADGWGYALLDPSTIQADNGAGLTKGVIGLVNKGQPRTPED